MTARPTIAGLAALLLASCLSMLAAGCRDPGPASSRRPGVTTQDNVRDVRVQKQFSSWDGSHLGVAKYIKQSLRDPRSFEHIDTQFDDRVVNLVVTTTYWYKDPAGQRVKGSIKAKVDLDGNILEVISHSR
jgi:hypothetical protein